MEILIEWNKRGRGCFQDSFYFKLVQVYWLLVEVLWWLLLNKFVMSWWWMLWCWNFILFSIECKDRISTNSKIINIQTSLRWSFDCWFKIWWKMIGTIGCNDSMLQSLESFRCWNYWTAASVRRVWKQTQKKGTALALCKRAGASPPLSFFW